MSQPQTEIHQEIQENLETLTRVPRLGGPIGRLANALDRVLLTLAVIALVGLSLTVLLQVASRLFLPITLSWTEELTRYLFIYMVAMGAGVVQHRHRHVNVELFHGWLGFRGRAAYLALVSAITFAFTLVVLPNAWQFAQIGAFQTSPTLRIPMLYIFFSSVVLFATLLLYSLIGLAEGIIAMVRGERQEAL
ncbi:TRAP transporter small permease [Salinicola sp. CR57]|uniref:TRAP transporter small permease n=1 Tax=Salinicola sp. CR57 TaxID=1949086 RepID=UPI000DA24522|nr:TRAP transporter small permease [Salinicola sp. CR57]